MSATALGSGVNQSPWLLAPAAEWDMRCLPSAISIAQGFSQNGAADAASALANTTAFKMSDWVQQATLTFVNGTTHVATFPELGTAQPMLPTSYGLVAAGMSTSSANTFLGLPGYDTMYMFVNLYYYYDKSLYPEWPDACGAEPITSGWLMPRNVSNGCAPQASLVSGS